MNYFNRIFLYSLLGISLSSALLSHDEPQKHSLLDSTHVIANTSPRHDELLGKTIQIGRILADPSTIDLTSWTHYLAKDIAMPVAASTGCLYYHTRYSPLNQLLLATATAVGITIGLTTSLAYTMVKYNRWQLNRHTAHIKQLISRSTNQADLLTAHELMCRYLTEVSLLAFGHDKNTAIQECSTILRDLINTLHHRISDLKKEEQSNRIVENS